MPKSAAQLAITEVMTSGATNCAGIWTNSSPDFWELTNFSTNAVDLSGYRFWDRDVVQFQQANPLPAVVLGPGETMIFVRGGNSRVPDTTAFRQWWWGDGGAGSTVQIHFYQNRPGFDELGDGVRLWDGDSNLVAAIDFGEAAPLKGVTFTSDPTGALIGIPNQIGVCGAFRAASCDDVGSPGFAGCGPVGMSIVEQPQGQVAQPGSDVTLRIRANGLPMPRGYQWYFNGTPISANGSATESVPPLVNFAGCGLAWKPTIAASDLIIRNVQAEHSGQYFVVFTNGLENMTSSVASITVNTTPTAPQIECPPSVTFFPTADGRRETNLALFQWQTATFDVFAQANPAPSYRWSWSVDGRAFTDLPGATNRLLSIAYVQPSHAGIYRVRIQNALGTNYAHAGLTVVERPQLRITEAMGLTCEPSQNDWWELTNTGHEAVNLAGYRWDDSPGNIGGGSTIASAVVIEPGESVILMESQTPASFRAWWGLENLPPNLKFIVYSANGLTETGDEIKVWNHSATEEPDHIDSVVFSASVQGASFWIDSRSLCEDAQFGVVSRVESCGSFAAKNGCDVGSPGWTQWTPPIFSRIRRDMAGTHLEWKAQLGSTNLVQFTSELAGTATTWTDQGLYSFSKVTGTATDITSATEQRFYRIVRASAAICPCPTAL